MSLSNVVRAAVVPAVRTAVPVVGRVALRTAQNVGAIVVYGATVATIHGTVDLLHTALTNRRARIEREANATIAAAEKELNRRSVMQAFQERTLQAHQDRNADLARAVRCAYPGASDADILHTLTCAAAGAIPMPAE